ncbi:hypothetical protein GGR56DRAFT_653929 [Xylariaceae sp. FL0804]|nr:hypothetical protein GGR56DRAFT_653929 [Xylariaceae sp. FL0804]
MAVGVRVGRLKNVGIWHLGYGMGPVGACHLGAINGQQFAGAKTQGDVFRKFWKLHKLLVWPGLPACNRCRIKRRNQVGMLVSRRILCIIPPYPPRSRAIRARAFSRSVNEPPDARRWADQPRLHDTYLLGCALKEESILLLIGCGVLEDANPSFAGGSAWLRSPAADRMLPSKEARVGMQDRIINRRAVPTAANALSPAHRFKLPGFAGFADAPVADVQ